MRYLILLILLLSFSKSILSQEKRKLINGEVKLDSLPIYDVHIVNLKTKIGTISNSLGEFDLPIKIGDSISISHLNLQNKIITITKKHLVSLKLTIVLKEQTTTLKEFTLEKGRSIFEEDKDIFTYSGPPVNANTLNLPYANTKAKVDKTIFKLSSGAVVSLDNLMGFLNGSNKREKVLKKIRLEDDRLLKIRKYFTDDFFITDLQIQEAHINSFLNSCMKRNIIYLFNKKDNLTLTTVLLSESRSFPQKENSVIKLALKKN
ncbi:hypothetical protein SHK09_03330 [Polaribacter sp. PL03]|uniref:hypothetical protein n=1 Tax=Polaribacter sp. PL03 TaxID=3088353 RepID=UPI0029CF9AFA|nr:hypothetical protein [Polaribacter sp. PL03]MDX6745812.1 hypothetical protein [Polaribacter sp. PL03]